MKTFQTKTAEISHYISFGYKKGNEFDLVIYAVQIRNSKLILLYEVISGKVRNINREVEKIENKFDYNDFQQSFAKNDTNNYVQMEKID